MKTEEVTQESTLTKVLRSINVENLWKNEFKFIARS